MRRSLEVGRKEHFSEIVIHPSRVLQITSVDCTILPLGHTRVSVVSAKSIVIEMVWNHHYQCFKLGHLLNIHICSISMGNVILSLRSPSSAVTLSLTAEDGSVTHPQYHGAQ